MLWAWHHPWVSTNLVLQCNFSCTARWDEWIAYHFGSDGGFISFYEDSDGDGLINALEYYADDFFSPGEDVASSRESVPIQDLGLNPRNADTDGDGLFDGFEFSSGLNGKSKGCTKRCI